MELHLEPQVKIAIAKQARKPHPLKGKHKWSTNNRHKREIIMANLRKGWHSKSEGKKIQGKNL